MLMKEQERSEHQAQLPFSIWNKISFFMCRSWCCMLFFCFVSLFLPPSIESNEHVSEFHFDRWTVPFDRALRFGIHSENIIIINDRMGKAGKKGSHIMTFCNNWKFLFRFSSTTSNGSVWISVAPERHILVKLRNCMCGCMHVPMTGKKRNIMHF